MRLKKHRPIAYVFMLLNEMSFNQAKLPEFYQSKFFVLLFICSKIRFFILLQLNLIYSKPVLDYRRSKTFCALTWLCAFIKTTALSIRLREKLCRIEDTISIDFERSQSSIIVVFIIILAKSYLLALQQDFVT